ncbi:MAG: AMP-binding enzyme, partial [Streptosporangiaceae bacterium]
YPREIEDFLLAHDGVAAAAVVGARDDVLGERPVAYVVPAGSWSPDKLEYALREACEAGLPRARRPSAVFVLEQMPLGPTGKIARRRLRELAADIPAGRSTGR